jgi:uncharacterized protein YllA (UPF0747 family)
MATEDHDFEEINHFKTANGFYQIKGNSGGAVGRIIIEDNSFLEEFEKNLKMMFSEHSLFFLPKKLIKKEELLPKLLRFWFKKFLQNLDF